MVEFFEANSHLVMLAGAIVVAAAIVILIRGGRARPSHFPSPEADGVLFEESFVSGRSHRSLFTANNCLRVAVGDGRLWIFPQFPFRYVARRLDLDQRIPLEAITHVERRGKTVAVEFRTDDGELRTVRLRLRKSEALEEALRGAAS